MYYIYIIYRERSIQKIGHWENDNGNLEFVKANLKVVQLMKFARKAFIKIIFTSLSRFHVSNFGKFVTNPIEYCESTMQNYLGRSA